MLERFLIEIRCVSCNKLFGASGDHIAYFQTEIDGLTEPILCCKGTACEQLAREKYPPIQQFA